MTTIKLEKGKALIINGPQGCGKTTLAIEIAKEHGTYKVIRLDAFTSPFILGDAMLDEPNTLIVDEFKPNYENLEHLKSIISNDLMQVNQMYKEPWTAKTPNFILCTGSKDPIKLTQEDRRFAIIEM
jgi:uridine kinase